MSRGHPRRCRWIGRLLTGTVPSGATIEHACLQVNEPTLERARGDGSFVEDGGKSWALSTYRDMLYKHLLYPFSYEPCAPYVCMILQFDSAQCMLGQCEHCCTMAPWSQHLDACQQGHIFMPHGFSQCWFNRGTKAQMCCTCVFVYVAPEDKPYPALSLPSTPIGMSTILLPLPRGTISSVSQVRTALPLPQHFHSIRAKHCCLLPNDVNYQ